MRKGGLVEERGEKGRGRFWVNKQNKIYATSLSILAPTSLLPIKQ
jgi:hypothetical protein